MSEIGPWSTPFGITTVSVVVVASVTTAGTLFGPNVTLFKDGMSAKFAPVIVIESPRFAPSGSADVITGRPTSAGPPAG